jgi:Calcineurin-like phosphoesterase
MGDPQAPFQTVLAVLRHHGLLGDDERLRPEVQLISMGDHFDWGPPAHRRQATSDALTLLKWLASHAPQQVVLLAGNHDLARVSELSHFRSDAEFEVAWALARQLYESEAPTKAAQTAFLERYPHLPDVECLARDFSCFGVEQTTLVTTLLRQRRLRLAHAHRGLLLVHAGLTEDDFQLVGDVPTDAASAAERLNALLDERVATWVDGPLQLGPLHRPGTKALGEARGIVFQRPAFSSTGAPFPGPPRRRFDPCSLPRAFPQAVGHTRDGKARELLGPWTDGAPARDGPIRTLRLENGGLCYGHGVSGTPVLYFLDGGMNHIEPERYELFDLDLRAPYASSKVEINGT